VLVIQVAAFHLGVATLWYDTDASLHPSLSAGLIVLVFRSCHTAEVNTIFVPIDLDKHYRVPKHALVAGFMLDGIIVDAIAVREVKEVTKVHILNIQIWRAFRDISRDPAGRRRDLAGTVNIIVGVTSGDRLAVDRVPGWREGVPPPGRGHVLSACGGGGGGGGVERHY